MNLTEKQTVKLTELLKSVNFGDANQALNSADVNPSLANLKAARKAVAVELRKLDKALAVYGLDLALDEAKSLVEKAEKRL